MDLRELIERRIADLKAQRQVYVEEANRQVLVWNGAIAVLEGLLAEAGAAEGEADDGAE